MVPMIGFGFVDNTIMIHAADAIDCTIGVMFGLSTITAAALGATVSNASGIAFGTTLERVFSAAGLPSANLSPAQNAKPIVGWMKLFGGIFGVM